MLTSLLAGFVIFGILGNLAHELDTTVDQVIKGGGTSLAFVSYPQALANFPGVPQVSRRGARSGQLSGGARSGQLSGGDRSG